MPVGDGHRGGERVETYIYIERVFCNKNCGEYYYMFNDLYMCNRAFCTVFQFRELIFTLDKHCWMWIEVGMLMI